MDEQQRLARNLAARGYLLEVDPLRPPETDDILPAAEYVTGYDAGWTDHEHHRTWIMQSTAFGLGIVIGMILAMVVVYAQVARPAPASNATPRSAVTAIPTADGKGHPIGVLPASGNPSRLTGAPSGVNALVRGALHPMTGWATFYDAPSSSDAAAGPALRRALGPHWRGSTVVVCASSCVTVRLTDWCACGKRHGIPTVIDLDDQAFASIAKLSAGVVRVRVTTVGEIDVPSTSRPTAPPTDVER